MAAPDSCRDAMLHDLYSNHHSWLLGWLRRRLDSAANAEDLAHDTYFRVLSAQSLPVIREPRAFLSTIARSLVINRYRRQALEQAYLDYLTTLPVTLAPSPEHTHLLLEALDCIDRALEGLPLVVRKAFLLAQLEGMKYQQIAEQLGISLISVKRHIKKALVHCMLHLEAP